MKKFKEKTCKDVFHAFLVEDAYYEGKDEIPCIKTSKDFPNRIITFSKALRTTDYDQWVAFYENDECIARIWNNPRRYLPILKRFRGIIAPDFSLYRTMPIVMQKWSTYKSRALANWFISQGIEVIPNVRFADPRSYEFCFLGVEHYSTIAIGSIGCLNSLIERGFFIDGLKMAVNVLKPKTIVVYGSAPSDIFDIYISQGIRILQFDSNTSAVFKGVTL